MTPRRLLVVDDSAAQRRVLCDIARASGRYAVVGEAADGSEAVRLYRDLRPDLVVMDIVMPGTDGIEAVRQLVSQDPRARVVMVCSLGQEALVMESLVAGAADYVARPLDTPAVLRAFDEVASR